MQLSLGWGGLGRAALGRRGGRSVAEVDSTLPRQLKLESSYKNATLKSKIK